MRMATYEVGLPQGAVTVKANTTSINAAEVMRTRYLLFPYLSIITLIVTGCSESSAQQPDIPVDAEQEVWNTVTSYAAAHAAQDVDAYLSYFHPDFEGWYFGDTAVTTLEDRKAGLTWYFDNIEIVEYTPSLKQMQLHGNLAVVHYTLSQRVRMPNGDVETWVEYWTDILKKEGERWLLVADHGHRL